jgi:hypothetical protein
MDEQQSATSVAVESSERTVSVRHKRVGPPASSPFVDPREADETTIYLAGYLDPLRRQHRDRSCDPLLGWRRNVASYFRDDPVDFVDPTRIRDGRHRVERNLGLVAESDGVLVAHEIGRTMAGTDMATFDAYTGPYPVGVWFRPDQRTAFARHESVGPPDRVPDLVHELDVSGDDLEWVRRHADVYGPYRTHVVRALLVTCGHDVADVCSYGSVAPSRRTAVRDPTVEHWKDPTERVRHYPDLDRAQRRGGSSDRMDVGADDVSVLSRSVED